MKNPVHTLSRRLTESGCPYEALGPTGGARAHIRFLGLFEGREVVWDARLYALRTQRPVAARPFIDIAPHRDVPVPREPPPGRPTPHAGRRERPARGRDVIGIRIGLAVECLDTPTLLKAMVMVRNYKRLRRGRHEFGEAIPRPALKHHVVEKIISGGQTGVDRAALDIALELGIPCGGWCPKGRRAEDGTIPPRYPLAETETGDYRQRTRRNVHDADGTLILTRGELTGGSALTRTFAEKLGKPCLVVDLAQDWNMQPARAWIETNGIGVLNVAGPRAAGQPGIYDEARCFLVRMLCARKPVAQSPARRKKASRPST